MYGKCYKIWNTSRTKKGIDKECRPRSDLKKQSDQGLQWQIQRGLLQLPFEAKLFHFHGEFSEKSEKIINNEVIFTIEPPFVNLNPLSRNPGSTPGLPCFYSDMHFVTSRADSQHFIYVKKKKKEFEI